MTFLQATIFLRAMTFLRVICALLSVIYSGASAAAASINITFDDLDASAADLLLAGVSPYQGFTWSNFSAYTNVPGFPGFNNGIVSLANAAYSGGEEFSTTLVPIVGRLTATTPFDFVSGFLGAGYYDNLNVTVQGRLGGAERFSRTVTVNTQGAQLFDFSFTNIDELAFFAARTASTADPFGCGPSNCTQFTLDNAVIVPTATPEPSTIVHLSLGGLTLFILRQKNRAVLFKFLASLRRSACLTSVMLMGIPTMARTPVNGRPPVPLRDTPSLARLASQFEEPLVATKATSRQEDEALWQAIRAYREQGGEDNFQAFDAFLSEYPHSGWRIALLTNLGLSYYHYGYFSRAISAWEQAYRDGRSLTDARVKPLVDRAIGELIRMHARVGHADQVDALLKEVENRPVSGSATEAIDGAKQGLWVMRNEPGIAYLCGPMALRNLLVSQGSSLAAVQFLSRVRSGPKGFTLAQVADLAEKARLPYRIISRSANQPIPVPSLVHWKVSHFAAIVGQQAGRFHIQDPTFGTDLWVTRKAIETEASGYFLVSRSQRAANWRSVPRPEAAQVRGMGYTSSSDPSSTTSQDDTTSDDNSQTDTSNEHNNENDSTTGDTDDDSRTNRECPLCAYTITEMIVSVRLSDTPVGYRPPKGPAMFTRITYNQREASQPATFGWFNVSPKWTLNWLSYVQDDPNAPGANVTRDIGGGGSIGYSGYNGTTGTFTPETRNAAVLVRTLANPITYQRRRANGGVEVFSQSNGATSFPRRIFLKQIIDPAGNTLTFNYDDLLRLISITDATGRATTFSYGLATRPLLVTEITDPFGRSAQLSYDANGRLGEIKDVIGLTSQFKYDASGLINTLTTPYGTTTFLYGENGNQRFVQATDPLGNKERVEFNQSVASIPFSDPENTVPQGLQNPFNRFQDGRNTYIWDKHAFAVAAGDYTKARIKHWTHWAVNTGVTANTLESIKNPLENRIWYNYPGQLQNNPALGTAVSGTLDKRTIVARVLDNGTTQRTVYSYNSAGKVTSIIDPVGRQTTFLYDPANNIDLLSIQQKTSASGYSTVAQFTYNNQHRPLTATDAAGQKTNFDYNSAGQLTQVTNALGQVTKYEYDELGYLKRIVNPNSETAVSFTYDAFGRMATRTDSEGHLIGLAYDAADRITAQTFPDGTTRQFTYDKLDLVSVKGRQGRITQYAYDAVRNLVQITDPLERKTKFAYYENQKLRSLTDPNGNTTNWNLDIQSRVTAKRYADGKQFTNGYETTTSRLKLLTDAIGQKKQYAYTLDNQLAGITYADAVNPTPAVSFSYDPFFRRVTAMTDANGMTQYQYVPPGSPGALQVLKEDGPFQNDTITYQYDALLRVTERTVDTAVETMSYDHLGRPTTHSTLLGTFDLTYLGQSRQIVSQALRGMNVGTTWEYNDDMRDRRIKAIKNSGASRSYEYTTTVEGLISEARENTGSISQLWSYTYDNAERLLQASSGAVQYVYTYDGSENITSVRDTGGTKIGTYNTVNQIATFGVQAFVYDAAGNVVDDGLRTFKWDAENRLVSVTTKAQPNQSTIFRYDGRGRRIAIVSGGTETRYLWCGVVLCQARSANDIVTRRYYPEGEMISGAGTLLYYSQDQLGSVRDLVAIQNGTRVASFDYSPYGQTAQSTGRVSSDFRYAHMFYDQNTGLYLTRYRVYDPAIGRWLSRDPIGERAGVNVYAYAVSNPVKYVDPTGLRWEFSQSTGQWTYVDEDTGERTDVGTGYSGHGEGLNNPDMQDQPNVGPTPQGDYTIGPQQDNVTNSGTNLPASMRLTPQPGTDAFGRGGFIIHGDNAAGNQTASEGCPIANRDIRNQIGDSGDTTLRVVP